MSRISMATAQGICSARAFLVGTALVIAASSVAAAQTSTQAPGFETIFEFAGDASGLTPEAGVIIGPSGSLFGTTDSDGVRAAGVVFQLLPPSAGHRWLQKVLFGFNYAVTGGYPLGLTHAPGGTLFGVTFGGGGQGGGTVFRLDPPRDLATRWSFTRLHVFQDGDDGALPTGQLLLDGDFGLTGTTLQGGAGAGLTGGGVAFHLTPPTAAGAPWRETILHRFAGSPDGATPLGLVAAPAGTAYGTSATGGTGLCINTGCGTAFVLRTTGKVTSEQVIHDFKGGPDGAGPSDRLVADPRGSFYGTTSTGGIPGPSGHFEFGTVFRLNPPTRAGAAWTKTTLYEFQGADDGFLPQAGLVRDAAGALYGTTYLGGPKHLGTVFKLTPPSARGVWRKTLLHGFGGGPGDGAYPTAALTADRAGALFGTTLQGGSGNFGTVFKLTP